MVLIIDYGIGNLRSIEKAFEAVGADVVRSDRAEDVRRAEKIVLPGVGAFGACIGEIRRRTLDEPILQAIETGKPFLGVCVGMQLLFDVGEELGEHAGLGVLRGRVLRLDAIASRRTVSAVAATDEPEHRQWDERLKIPHMGWNTIEPVYENPLLHGLPDEAYFYFVHSFAAVPEDSGDVLASTGYGVDFPAVVHRNNVFGVQFHPEKSQRNGLQILQNFAELVH